MRMLKIRRTYALFRTFALNFEQQKNPFNEKVHKTTYLAKVFKIHHIFWQDEVTVENEPLTLPCATVAII